MSVSLSKSHQRTLTNLHPIVMELKLAAFICLVSIFKANGLPIQTKNGLISGNAKSTRLGRTSYSFLGIPYAKPPVGDLRFEPPQPAGNWSGVRDGSVFGDSCYQPGYGKEDCLYLNVFTQNVGESASRNPFPVMVYIHGGSFQSGNPRGNVGDYLLDEDVILVGVNYRLHSLGFLNTGDGLIKGNMGLKDMALALEWVRDNIASFGGDPSRVTVFGQSAGGAAVSYLLLSPLTKGLLHSAISQSGTAIKIWSFQPKPKEQAQLLASRLNCDTTSPAAMVACLKKADVAELTRLSTLSGGAWKNDLEPFMPSIETVAQGAFISKHPYDIIRDGEAHRVPWISGVNTGEGLLYTYPIRDNECLRNRVNSNWTAVAPKFLLYDASRTDITQKITKFYFGNAAIDFRAQFAQFTQLWTDRLYITFTRRAGELQSKFSPVYFYYNDYQVNPGFVANHGAEMFMLFPGLPAVGTNSPHYNRSRNMVKLWTEFAAGGSTLNFEGSRWDPIDVSSGGIKYLKFSNDFNGIVEDPIRDRVQLWDELDQYRLEPVNAGPISYC